MAELTGEILNRLTIIQDLLIDRDRAINALQDLIMISRSDAQALNDRVDAIEKSVEQRLAKLEQQLLMSDQ